MVVNPHSSTAVLFNQDGQSILEVVFVLPLLFLFVGLLYKINLAIQMGINNTQYARSQVYVLTANSPEYPRLSFRWSPSLFAAKDQDRMVLGVSDPKALELSNRTGDLLEPMPQTQKIARIGSEVKGSSERGEPALRNEIRVRSTSAICTQLNSVGGKEPITPGNLRSVGSKRWPFGFSSACQFAGYGNGLATDAEE